jgi:hypothetical protein
MALAESNNFELKPCALSNRIMPVRIDGSSSTTKTELRVGKWGSLKFSKFALPRVVLTHSHQIFILYLGAPAGNAKDTLVSADPITLRDRAG